jgi:hypothetical protein
MASSYYDTLLEMHGLAPAHERPHYSGWLTSAVVAEFLKTQEPPLEQGLGADLDRDERADVSSSADNTAEEKHNPSDHRPPTATLVYSLRADAPEPHHPEVAELKQAAQKLVELNMITEADLNRLSLRMTNPSQQTPEALKSSESAYEATGTGRREDLVAVDKENEAQGTSTNFSFATHGGNISVDEIESRSISPPSFQEHAVLSTFLHELGHGVRFSGSDHLEFDISEAVKGTQAYQENPELVTNIVNKALVQGSDMPAGHQRLEERWQTAVGEAYGDVFGVVALQALHGKEVALADLDAKIAFREKEYKEVVQYAQQSGGGLVEGHHTTRALLSLRDQIENGETEAALKGGYAMDLIAENVAAGLLKEYEAVRMAELNPHHMKDGQILPGLPPEISKEEFLQADLNNFNGYKTGAIVFVSKEEWQKLEESGTQVYPDNPGSTKAPHRDFQDLPGFEVVAVPTAGLVLAKADGSHEKITLAEGAQLMDAELKQLVESGLQKEVNEPEAEQSVPEAERIRPEVGSQERSAPAEQVEERAERQMEMEMSADM